MGEVLIALLQANLAAAAAIILVLALRRPIRGLAGVRIAYTLWLIVPLAVAASFAPMPPADLLPASVLAPPLVAAAEESAALIWAAGAARSSGIDPTLPVAALWLAGVAFMAAGLMDRQRRFLRLLRTGQAGPAVVGILRPRIVTPADFFTRFNAPEREVVIAHEKVHLSRGDAQVNALVALARCLCWFNPLVHAAAHLMRMDQELACDAAVLARNPASRAVYAEALLKAQLARSPLPLGCYWPSRAVHPLMVRIALLKRAAPSRRRRLAGAVVLAGAMLGAGYGAWAAAPSTQRSLDYVEAALPSQPAQIDPRDVDAQGRPKYGQPFVARYDADDPITVTGVAVRTDFLQPNVAVWVYGRGVGKEGRDLGERLWRVDGGATLLLSPETRASAARLVGAKLKVRGYGVHDKSCSPTCRLQGRELTLPSGEFILQMKGKPTCTLQQLRDYSCPGSDKVSPMPTPPSAQEIAAAVARAGGRI